MKKLLIAILVLVGVYNVYKPLPEGTDILGDIRLVPDNSVHLVTDTTYLDRNGMRVSEQYIFDELLDLIDGARHYILVDMFLFNSFQGEHPETARPLAKELADALIAKKQAVPDIAIVVITDPINTVYGGSDAPELDRLRKAGIPVVFTDLRVLRDSNPIYSALWRVFIQWFGNTRNGSALPHPFAAGKYVTVRSYLDMFNFKANHRKVLVADQPLPDGTVRLVTLITSLNPHDASSAHSNVALIVEDGVWRDAVRAEEAVMRFSGSEDQIMPIPTAITDRSGPLRVRYVSESKIRDLLVRSIAKLRAGDSLDMLMFYLSDRSVVEAIQAAAQRGVTIRLLLDPNKDAFGHKKNGIPNRQVAAELVNATSSPIAIRWCDTHGEQCHAKLILMEQAGSATLLVGSANLTRRNIGGYNLEADIAVTGTSDARVFRDARAYFDQLWNNTLDGTFSVSYETYAEDSLVKYWLYRIMEATGISTF